MSQANPVGVIRHDELLNILVGAVEAGLDYKTVAIIARQTGVRQHFDQEMQQGAVTVEGATYLLLDIEQRKD